MSAHADHCGCAKPEGAWGDSGWHMFESKGGDGVTVGGNPLTEGRVYAYEKCPSYWKAKREKAGLSERLLAAGVPPAYLDYTRKGFKDWPEAASAFLRNANGMLYIFGSNGTGKTRLATAIFQELFEEGICGRWVSAKLLPDYIERTRPRWNEPSPEEMRLEEAPVLVLDDLFSEKGTPAAVALVRNLVEVRYLAKRTTIITSMLSPEEAIIVDSDLTSRVCSDKRIERRGVDQRFARTA